MQGSLKGDHLEGKEGAEKKKPGESQHTVVTTVICTQRAPFQYCHPCLRTSRRQNAQRCGGWGGGLTQPLVLQVEGNQPSTPPAPAYPGSRDLRPV